jgi:hypothetical protein
MIGRVRSQLAAARRIRRSILQKHGVFLSFVAEFLRFVAEGGCVSAFRATHLDWALPGKDLEPKNSSPEQLDDWATHFANTLYDRARRSGLSESSYIFPQYRALHSRRFLSPFAVWSNRHASSAAGYARLCYL